MKISTINIYPDHIIRHFLNMVKTSYIIHFFNWNTKQKYTLIIVVVGVVDCHHLQPMSIVRGSIGPIPLLRVAVRRQPAGAALLRLHSGCSRSLLISWWPAASSRARCCEREWRYCARARCFLLPVHNSTRRRAPSCRPLTQVSHVFVFLKPFLNFEKLRWTPVSELHQSTWVCLQNAGFRLLFTSWS